MSKQKPSLPKGTRDFGPDQMRKRTYILDTIKTVFQKFGFQPLETPTMEKLSVLTGKYGDEGDQLLFKVLDSGDFFSSVNESYRLSDQSIVLLTISLSDVIDQVYNEIEKGRFVQHIGPVSEESRKQIKSFIRERFEKKRLSTGLPTGDVDDILLDDGFLNFFTRKTLEIVTGYNRLSVFIDGDLSKRDEASYVLERNAILYRKDFSEFIKSIYASKRFSRQTVSTYITPFISQKGLRYDLTVPFARYVVMNQHEITFPFRRYQVQPVWRADRPQRGRYREFYQCDADVVGTNSLLCEAEIVLMLEEVFAQLQLTNYTIKINDRRLLHGLVEVLDASGKETDLLVAIDKLDKIGEEKVLDELRARGFSRQAIEQLQPALHLSGSNAEQLNQVEELLKDSSVGQEGVAALREVMTTAQALGSSLGNLSFDLTLARGLSYYTGAIFEVKANQGSLTSSISGGGRYDNLTGVFGLPGVSGVGISFGVDRIYDVLDELDLFPEASRAGTQVLFINFDADTARQVLPLVSQVRRAGIAAELYPEPVKLKKQFAYADKKNILYAVVIGSEELASQQYSLKNLRTGEQESLSLDAIIKRITQ